MKASGRKDWLKLVRMMKCLSGTQSDILTLSIGKDVGLIEWFVNAAFTVHPDYRGHTGACMRFQGGKGCPIQKSCKQKLNASSSTTTELIGVDDALPKVLWTPLFIEDQGYKVHDNLLNQDNTSAIQLEKNGKRSSGERTRAINIRYFLITDHVNKGDVRIQYCPTDKMLSDFYTKPLQGSKFHDQRKEIMGMS